MKPSSDDYDEMNEIGEIRGDHGGPMGSAGETPAVTQFLGDLRSLGDGPVPEPSPELAALLGAPDTRPGRRHRLGHTGRVVARSALAAAAVIVATTVAAASNNLPQPAQRVVSDVVNRVTPFHLDPNGRAGSLPEPAPEHPAPVRPQDDRTAPAPARGAGSAAQNGGDGADGGGDGTAPGSGNGSGSEDDGSLPVFTGADSATGGNSEDGGQGAADARSTSEQPAPDPGSGGD